MSALTSHLRKYSAAPVCHDIQINGQLVGLHDSGVLWWPDEATLWWPIFTWKKAPAMPAAA
jgi:hypothetical protein